MDLDNAGKVVASMGIVMAVLALVVTVVIVAGVFLVLRRVFGGLGRARAERERLLRDGVQAPARILNVAMGRMTMTVGVHRHLQLDLTLEVEPAGRPPYQATVTTMVSELQIPQVQPGGRVSVRYDPANPASVVLEGVGVPGAGGAAAIPLGNVPGVPAAAKIGLVVGGCGALIGILAALIAVAGAVFGLKLF
jgi:hypothetical protein